MGFFFGGAGISFGIGMLLRALVDDDTGGIIFASMAIIAGVVVLGTAIVLKAKEIKDGEHRRAAKALAERTVERTNREAKLRALMAVRAAAEDRARAKHRTLEDAGIRAGEVVAWRCWRERDGKLFSIAFRNHEWVDGRMSVDPDGLAIEVGGGVHAWKDEQKAQCYAIEAVMFDNLYRQAMASPYRALQLGIESTRLFEGRIIVGRVKLWGEIVEHEFGYRAEHARKIDEGHEDE